MKKGSLAVNIIIVAAICLVVLIIMIAVFGQNIKKWGSGVEDCRVRGGKCETRECNLGQETELINTNCKEPNHCCVQIFGDS